MLDYIITIETDNQANASTNGPVYMKIFGTNGRETDEILLKQTSGENQLQMIDIGKPERMIIRHEDMVNGWFLGKVNVVVQDISVR